ncbi:MAG: methionine adenosyltransferase [Candidatus Marinimicrobia bacterium]|nr:methionine adenosyltransferase [Candidatus Neomarinimicrobiota bacterium]
MSGYLFTSESVTEGHPDKVCDGISDAILDACLKEDPGSRVACETLVKTGMIVLAGEITTTAHVNYADVARAKACRIGYDHSNVGFDGNTCAVLVAIDRQSPDISQGVTAGQGLFKEQGAGDQGMMFGYACDETPELMPLPITLANQLTRRLAQVRRKGALPFLAPDGKSQVSVRYEQDRPVAVDTVVISSQHCAEVKYRTLRDAIIEEVIRPTVPARLLSKETRFLVNPTGRFVIGGPQGDAGVTGRKIIVDTYGGMGRHGGGAFSGKDPSKVDRSAAYMARYVAKNIVAAKLARRCEVQLAYAIGYPEPVSVMVSTFGTSAHDEADLAAAVRQVFGLKPAEIIKQLDLLRPVYEATSAYGHFGRKSARDLAGFTWERTDRADALREAL